MSVCVSVYYVFVLMCLELCMSRGQWEWWVCKRVTASSLYIAPPSAPRLALGAVLKFQPNSSGQISTKSRLCLTAIGYLRTALNHFQRSTSFQYFFPKGFKEFKVTGIVVQSSVGRSEAEQKQK